ncbi:MAG: deoxyribose-phosphate aldolase [Pirellulaceae bacterium]|jgi:deoxyribose-phosphate aldolase|nr:deoxyribose-phosphate aldolase [Mariniblastus sp.]MDB4756275.1 deoxyribose-phosphate aldolase [Mariniblastus sp.]MDG2470063.1 deoxyribose-phosphate aldolase [Pirellulaceae bacterium]
MSHTYEELAKMIDHALLSPTLTVSDLDQGIELALAYDVASVCIMPFYLKACSDRLAGTQVKTSTTIGFPHGGQATSTKCVESEKAIADGCQELDVVTNISQVLSGNWNYVHDELQRLIEIAHAADRQVKIIFENCYLNEEQKIRLCQICSDLKADWVKTSTGYGTSGATEDDLRLMRLHSGEHVQIKAAGGIGDIDQLISVREIGVTRCGASRTKTILDELRKRLELSPIETVDSISGKSSY